MNRLGIGRATIVGSSYGVAVALTLTLDYPESVEKLVLSTPSATMSQNGTDTPVASFPGLARS